jgi:NADH-quinone oxidoreductase E subunit
MDDVLLLPILKDAQKRYGYLSEELIKQISAATHVPISQVYGVATFYSMLHTKEVGKNIIEICTSPTCTLSGSLDLVRFLKSELDIDFGETTKDKLFTLIESSCIGCCDNAPAMLLNGEPYSKLTEEKLKEIIKKCRS